MTEIKMFHHSTLAALMSGIYEGTLSMNDVLAQGNFGIGTLSGIEGEVIVLDGKAYQARADRSVSELSGTETTPYAAVVPFETVKTLDVEACTASQLLDKIQQYFSSQNLFHAIKITGIFDQMHVRISPGGKEGEAFVDIAARQPEYTEETISGTIVGFWTPDLFHGVSVAGYHLHFLSEDKKFGGHIIDFNGFTGIVAIGKIDKIIQNFPVNNDHFLKADLDLDKLRADIHEAE